MKSLIFFIFLLTIPAFANEPVIILIDSGVDTEQFRDQLFVFEGDNHPLMIDLTTDDENPVYQLTDDLSHGTKVFSIIHQQNPKAKVIPIKVFSYKEMVHKMTLQQKAQSGAPEDLEAFEKYCQEDDLIVARAFHVAAYWASRLIANGHPVIVNLSLVAQEEDLSLHEQVAWKVALGQLDILEVPLITGLGQDPKGGQFKASWPAAFQEVQNIITVASLKADLSQRSSTSDFHHVLDYFVRGEQLEVSWSKDDFRKEKLFGQDGQLLNPAHRYAGTGNSFAVALATGILSRDPLLKKSAEFLRKHQRVITEDEQENHSAEIIEKIVPKLLEDSFR